LRLHVLKSLTWECGKPDNNRVRDAEGEE